VGTEKERRKALPCSILRMFFHVVKQRDFQRVYGIVKKKKKEALDKRATNLITGENSPTLTHARELKKSANHKCIAITNLK
jgi:hypothetical protein